MSIKALAGFAQPAAGGVEPPPDIPALLSDVLAITSMRAMWHAALSTGTWRASPSGTTETGNLADALALIKAAEPGEDYFLTSVTDLKNGIVLAQATAGAQPQHVAVVNGYPTLDYDGVDDQMDTATLGAFAQPNATIFHGQLLSLQATIRNIHGSGVDAGAENSTLGKRDSTTGHELATYSGAPSPSGGVWDTDVHLVVVEHNDTSSRILVDGVAVVGPGASGARGLTTEFRLGANRSSAAGGRHAHMRWRSTYVLTALPSAGDLAAIEALEAAVWTGTAALELEEIDGGLTQVALTVDASPQQTFEGFGWSASEEDNPAINVDPGDEAAVFAWIFDDLHLRGLRLWGGPNTYTPVQLAGFYVTSGLIAEAQARGVTTIIPAHGTYTLGNPSGTAATLAQFWSDCIGLGIPFTHVGGPNEPGTGGVPNIPDAEIPTFATALRSELDGLGLTALDIFGPDWASHDAAYNNYADVMDAAGALGAIDHFAGHSYAMAADQAALTRMAASGKWEFQTESGGGDIATSGANGNVPHVGARILNDLNHGVAMWWYFLATGSQVDGLQKLVWIDGTGAPSRQPHYWLMRQAAETFLPGTVIRHVTSDLSAADGGTHMEWTYAISTARKPKIHGAAGLRSDGKWALGSINGTRDAGSTADGIAHWPGETIQVTMTVPGLAGFTGTVPVSRTGPITGNMVAGTADMVDGVVRFTLLEKEMITLQVNPG